LPAGDQQGQQNASGRRHVLFRTLLGNHDGLGCRAGTSGEDAANSNAACVIFPQALL